MGLRTPSVPFSKMDQQQSDQYARKVPVIPDPNSVDSDLIKNGAVTEPKFADGAVSTRAIAEKAVTPEKMSDANALTVFGNPLATNGTRADIALTANGQLLMRRANQLVGDVLVDSDIPLTIARDSEVTSASGAAQTAAEATAAAALAAHVADPDPHTGYQKESEKNAASGYAGLNAQTRTTKGVDTTDDLVIDLATKGIVLRDTQGTPHYWRLTISNLGALVITDIGTSKP